MITFKLISISWRDMGQLTSLSFISRLKKLFNPSFSYLFDKIIQKQLYILMGAHVEKGEINTVERMISKMKISSIL